MAASPPTSAGQPSFREGEFAWRGRWTSAVAPLSGRRMGCGGFGSVAEVAVGSIEGGEMIGVAATPLDEEDGRVVACDTASFLFQGVGRAHPRPHRRVVTDGSVGPLDELLFTERIICAVTKWSLPNCSLMALSMNAHAWDRPVSACRVWHRTR
ncbi:hypothetical protein GCM10009647_069600 [Streptomyces sanglieri]